MSLQEFDSVMERMQLAFDYASNLGQHVEAARILFQMNEQLPDDLQLTLETMEDESMIKSFISKYKSQIKSAVSEYRQQMMMSC